MTPMMDHASVPQSFMQGPLLQNIMCNDVLNLSDLGKARLMAYVEDIALVVMKHWLKMPCFNAKQSVLLWAGWRGLDWHLRKIKWKRFSISSAGREIKLSLELGVISSLPSWPLNNWN